jgi:hypothetical protein
MVLWLSYLRARRMRKMMRPSILIGELLLYFCFLAVILERFFLLVLFLSQQVVVEPGAGWSSPRA